MLELDEWKTELGILKGDIADGNEGGDDTSSVDIARDKVRL